MPYLIPDLLQLLVTERGEAIHLHPGEPPVVEIKRILHRIEGPPLGPTETETLLQSVASEDDMLEFKRSRMICFYYHFNDVAVFQMMAFREDGHVRLEIRRFR